MSCTDPYTSAVSILTAGQNHRVWSLLVTIFGDLTREPKAEISGATLGRITSEVGTKPEATRVALHRLRKDGWVESRKIGRSSAYSLSEYGRHQSLQATPIIYRWEQSTEPLFLQIDNGNTREADNTVSARQVFPAQVTLTKDATACDFALLVHPSSLPEWITSSLVSQKLIEDAHLLDRALTEVQNKIGDKPAFSATERAVLRILIIHSWRRIILKAPDLPDAVFPPEWDGPKCRMLVRNLLNALPKPSLQDLEADAES